VSPIKDLINNLIPTFSFDSIESSYFLHRDNVISLFASVVLHWERIQKLQLGSCVHLRQQTKTKILELRLWT